MNCNVKVAVIGHTTLDNLIVYSGESRFKILGGGGLYAVTGMSYWAQQGEVGFVTRVGKDVTDQYFSCFNRNSATNSLGIHKMDRKGIALWLLYDEDGYRHWILHNDACQRELATPIPDEIPEEFIEHSKGYHFSPIPLSQLEQLVQALPKDKVIQVDPHYEWFFSEYADRWKQVLKHVNVFLPSEDEFTKFFDIPLSYNVSLYTKYIKELAAMGPEVIILKLGQMGGLMYVKEEDCFYQIPSCSKTAREVTGAGDSFAGGFLFNHLNGDNYVTAAIKGMVSSSITLEHIGACENFAVPRSWATERYNEVEAVMRSAVKMFKSCV
jgi:sugar/nucleoside kinase (ribokinase family)